MNHPKITHVAVSLGDREVKVTWEDVTGVTGTTTVTIDCDYCGPNDWAWYVLQVAGEEPDYAALGNEGMLVLIEEEALNAYERADAEYFSEENQRG